ADALDQRQRKGERIRLEVERLAQAARGLQRCHAALLECQLRSVGIDRRQRAVVDQRAELRFGKSADLRQAVNGDALPLFDPYRFEMLFHDFDSCSKCLRGLNVETEASSLNSERSRSVSTVGTAICTTAIKS